MDLNLFNSQIRKNWPTYAIIAGIVLLVWGFSGYTDSKTVSRYSYVDERTRTRTIPGGFPSEARLEMVVGVLIATIGFANHKRGRL